MNGITTTNNPPEEFWCKEKTEKPSIVVEGHAVKRVVVSFWKGASRARNIKW
jgi:hypothetical protein